MRNILKIAFLVQKLRNTIHWSTRIDRDANSAAGSTGSAYALEKDVNIDDPPAFFCPKRLELQRYAVKVSEISLYIFRTDTAHTHVRFQAKRCFFEHV